MANDLPVRKNIRLLGYDYSSEGHYFITICVKNLQKLLGSIVDGRVALTECGAVAERNLVNIPLHINHVAVDKYVIMPNHVHIMLNVMESEREPYIEPNAYRMPHQTPPPTPGISRTPHTAPIYVPFVESPQAKSKQTVSKAIQQYKASVTRDTALAGIWQPRFHDHIVRNETDYIRICKYIDENPAKWAEDRYYS